MGTSNKLRNIRVKVSKAKTLKMSDARLKKNVVKQLEKAKKGNEEELNIAPELSSALFFQYNTALGPPYQVILDTNFINFSIKNKLDVIKSMMDCLFAKCVPCITDCVIAELEKLGSKFKMALKIAKDVRFKRIPCVHKGTYADDCIVNLVKQFRCYVVATCDADLKRRLRKIPGVPIMFIRNHQYSIERMPEAWGAPK